jgi:hypothetical protein
MGVTMPSARRRPLASQARATSVTRARVQAGDVAHREALGAGGDEGEAVDVELVAEEEAGALAAVVGEDADGAAEAGGADGVVERPGCCRRSRRRRRRRVGRSARVLQL